MLNSPLMTLKLAAVLITDLIAIVPPIFAIGWAYFKLVETEKNISARLAKLEQIAARNRELLLGVIQALENKKIANFATIEKNYKSLLGEEFPSL